MSPDKATLRRRLRAARRAFPEAERADLAARIAARAAALTTSLGARTIGLYAAPPHSAEVWTDDLAATLASQGAHLVWPRVGPVGLTLHRLDDRAELIPGFRGIPEPPPDAPAVLPEALDLLFVPGVGFDRAGGRLGQGGGYYDRLLAAGRPQTVAGLCFSVQLLAELPSEPFDQRVDYVITEVETLAFTPPRGVNQPTPPVRPAD